MKVCSKCKVEKSFDCFRKNQNRVDGLQSICADCSKFFNRKWYRENRLAKIVKNKKYLQASLVWLSEYKKTLQCSRCPESHYRCLDFHHPDGVEKDKSISDGVRSWSIQRLQKEIAKCIVLCANCHRKETFVDNDMVAIV